MNVAIGTCAWSFDDWRGVFYPGRLAPNRRLEFYAQHLAAVEIDSTFYHTPTPQMSAHWAAVTPTDFTFTCKLPREITHERRLRESTELVHQFLDGIAPLRPKLAAVLAQLPPAFSVKHDERALRDFLHALPRGWPFAIEFRRRDWHLPRIAHLLTEHGVAWVWSDATPLDRQAEGALELAPETADFAYVRLLGDLETKYGGDGSRLHTYRSVMWPREAALDHWAARIRECSPRQRRVVVLVSNHFEGFAPATCGRLAERLGLALKQPGLSELRGDAEDAGQMTLALRTSRGMPEPRRDLPVRPPN
jgi:uncharacterized protein YecE (DUF72 family)